MRQYRNWRSIILLTISPYTSVVGLVIRPAPVTVKHIGIPISPVPKVRTLYPSFSEIEHRALYFLDTRLSRLSLFLRIYHPSFCFHVTEIASNPLTNERPSVESNGDCWIIIEGAVYAVGLGARLKHGKECSTYIGYLYNSPVERREVADVGLFVVPTRNTIQEEIPGDRRLSQAERERNPGLMTKERVKREYELPELEGMRRAIPQEAHFKVQLTFGPRDRIERIEAESVFNSKDFILELGYLRNWNEIF